MAIPGQRFHLDLSQDSHLQPPSDVSSSLPFVCDVTERAPSSAPTPPSLPVTQLGSANGFPAHRKRTRASAFKRQRAPATRHAESADGSGALLRKEEDEQRQDGFEVLDRRRIHQENRQRIEAMSDEEIAQHRKELMEGLSPSLLERLLRKARLDDEDQETGAGQIRHHDGPSSTTEKPAQSSTSPPSAITPSADGTPSQSARDPEAAPTWPPSDLTPASAVMLPPAPRIHFPAAPPAPSLDPSAPDFLALLHEKYYPDLPMDPSKLAWMAPIPSTSPGTDADADAADGNGQGDANTDGDMDNAYSPTLPSLPPSSLRFAFTGALLPPRTALAIPVSEGLHHHGAAPAAAGYTIPELARLARSAFPAQRCVAYQTLGRILYRLGRGEFGACGGRGADADGDGVGDANGGTAALASGLWRCVHDGRVLEVLEAEARTETGHATAKALATEALWNWRRGGGGRWKAE